MFGLLEKNKKNFYRLLLVGFLTIPPLLLPGIALANVMATLGEVAHALATSIGGFFVTMGGFVLDLSILQLILHFGTLMQGNIGVAVDAIWTVLRDTINIFFIFGLIYIGLKIIWQSDDSSTRRQLGLLVVAALLVNFSLLITKIVIDFSNIAAVQIYSVLLAPEVGGAESLDMNENLHTGIAAQVMNLTDLTSFFRSEDIEQALGSVFMFSFMTMIFLIFTGLVFLAGGILIIVRFVALVGLMIFSPLMFVGWIIPPLKDLADDWRHRLINYSLFAPAYLFLVYVALAIIDSLKFTAGFTSGDLSRTQTEATFDAWSAILFLIIALFMMTLALTAANRLGVYGATTALKGLGWVRDKTVRGLTYVPRALGRKYVNAAGADLERDFNDAQNTWLGSKILSHNLVDRPVRRAATSMQQAEFGTGTTSKQEKVYRQATDERINAQRAVKDGLAASAGLANLPSGAGLSNKQKVKQQQKKEQYEAQINTLRQMAPKLTTHGLEAMSDEERKAILQYLTEDQVDKLLESDKLDNSHKKELRGVRQTNIRARVTEDGQVSAEKLAKLKLSELEKLDTEFINEHAHLLTPSQAEDLSKKSKVLNDDQREDFENERKTKLESAFTITPANAPDRDNKERERGETIDAIASRKPAEITKLPFEILMKPEMLPRLNSDVLHELEKGKQLSASKMAELGEAIINANANVTQNPTAWAGLSNKQKSELNKAANYLGTPRAADYWSLNRTNPTNPAPTPSSPPPTSGQPAP